MGAVILILMVILETIFTVYCVRTKSSQPKIRNWLRISEFGSFLLLTIATIIEWSFRWYLIAFVLFTMAAIATVRLLTRKLENKPRKTGRIIAKSLSVILLLSLTLAPALIFPQYTEPPKTGDYGVATQTYTYTDNERIETFSDSGENRKLTVQFWYPSDAQGKSPLIVFSHGAFGIRASNTSTYTNLASNGYIVCSIDHPYHAAGTVDTDGKLTIGSPTFMQQVVDINQDLYSEEEKLSIYREWMTLRTDDISFVLDTILEKAQAGNDPIFSMIDTGAIGLMGHSLGGAASVQLGRDRDDIDAVIDIDGTLLGEERGIVDGEVILNDEPYPLPILNFYSEYVIKELAAEPDYVYPNKYLTSISPTAYEICIRGSNHMSYTDLPFFCPLLADQLSGISGGDTSSSVDKNYCVQTMNQLILEFFNCYLKGDRTFTPNEYY